MKNILLSIISLLGGIISYGQMDDDYVDFRSSMSAPVLLYIPLN